jgi:hypothetical protein
MRIIYDMLGVIGDLGGVFEMIYYFFSLFFFPVSEFIFLLRTLNRLFQVKSKNH